MLQIMGDFVASCAQCAERHSRFTETPREWTIASKPATQNRLFLPSKQARDSKCVWSPGAFLQASARHASDQFRRRRKTPHRCRQVCIRTLIAGDKLPNPWQDRFEIHAVECADHPPGLVEVQNSTLAAGPQHAENLSQARIVIRKVTEAESRCNQIKTPVSKWQAQRIALDPCEVVIRGGFGIRTKQHGMGKISAGDPRKPCLFAESESHVSRTAAKIEGGRPGPAKNRTKCAGGSAPPEFIDIRRQEVIQQVIPRRDRCKHLADGARCRFRIGRSLGRGASDLRPRGHRQFVRHGMPFESLPAPRRSPFPEHP